MKKGRILILLMLTAFSLLAAGCGEGKYVLSGTWYADESADIPTYVFYDSGQVKIGDAKYAYEVSGEDALVIHMNAFNQTALVDRDTKIITLFSADGKETCQLFSSPAEAAKSHETKSGALAAEMSTVLSGSWMMEDGNTTMTFEGDTCAMTASHEGQEVKTRYKVIYPAEGRVQFVTDGSEVAAEFTVEQEKDTLVFIDEDGEKVKYVRKEG
ncbi:hypothetical protein ACDL92_12020 [Ihubacter sp. mB4P-1]|uniref:hypothetical protein n=1 Tax=Ihubacter sp. mB4P-1 TaxID=3242370 RepID=UPI003C7EAA0D